MREIAFYEEEPHPEEFLLDSARRYWLCTKLWIPTEADTHPPEWVAWEEPPHADDPTTGTQP